MCSPPLYKSELRLEFTNNLSRLNMLIEETQKILYKKHKLKKVKK